MGLAGVWGGDKPWELHVYGEPKTAGGDGRKWECSCPKGIPGTDGYPCGHILDAWEHAEQGLLSNSYNWTAYGEQLADDCRCQKGKAPPVVLRRMAPKERPAPPVGPSRNKPCPCGSERSEDGNPILFKYCHALPPDQRPLEARPWSGDTWAPPPPPTFTPEEEKEIKRGKRRIAKKEAAEERRKVIDAILDRVRAQDEARRARRRAARLAKKGK